MKETVEPQPSDVDSLYSNFSNKTDENEREMVRTALQQTHLNAARRLCGHWKMFIIIGVLLSGMLVFSVIAILNAQRTKTEAREALFNIEVTLSLTEILKALQRERGMSTNYLGTENSSQLTVDILADFRRDTDRTINDVRWPLTGIKIRDTFWTSEDILNSLSDHRKRVDTRDIDFMNTINYYTNISTALVTYFSSLVTVDYECNIQRIIDARNSLLAWTDTVGIKRALGTTFFSSCGWSSIHIGNRFMELKGRSSAFLDTAFAFDKNTQLRYTNAIDNSSSLESFINRHLTHALFEDFKHVCSTISKVERKDESLLWFHNMTLYIDTIFDIIEQSNDDTKSALNDLVNDADFEFKLILSIFLFIVAASGLMSVWYVYCMATLTGNLAKHIEKSKQKSRELSKEKQKSEAILYQLIPKKVAVELKSGNKLLAEHFNDVTLYFSDICGFTEIGVKSKPMEIVYMLNDLYSSFDGCIEKYDVYKVETIGDSYMVASGVPVPNGNKHAAEIALMSLQIKQTVKQYVIPHMPETKLEIRTGIHSGPCVAGVVGTKMPRYCLFGDTVNTASRMESEGIRGQIHISSDTQTILESHGNFVTEYRGEIQVKGKGLMSTFWLKGVKVESKAKVVISNNNDTSETVDTAMHCNDIKIWTTCGETSQVKIVNEYHK